MEDLHRNRRDRVRDCLEQIEWIVSRLLDDNDDSMVVATVEADLEKLLRRWDHIHIKGNAVVLGIGKSVPSQSA